MAFDINRHLADPTSEKTILIALRFVDPDTGGNKYLFVGNRHYYDVPNIWGFTERVEWRAAIQQGSYIETGDASRIRNGSLSGGLLRSGIGGIRIDNSNDQFSEFIGLDVDSAFSYIGDVSQPISNFLRRFIYVDSLRSLKNSSLTIETTDIFKRAEKKFCRVTESNSLYTEGVNETRPVAYGVLRHVNPLYLYQDSGNNRHFWRIHDQGATGFNLSFTTCYRGGEDVTADIETAGTSTIIRSSTTYQNDGDLHINFWGASMDGTEPASSGDLMFSTADILQHILDDYGITMEQSERNTLQAQIPHNTGLYERSTRYATNVIDEYIRDLFVCLWQDYDGTIRARMFYSPDGAEPVVLNVTDNDILDDDEITIDGSIQPVYRVETLYQRTQSTPNITVQNNSIKSLIDKGGRTTSDSDAQVELDYPSTAKELTLTTPLDNTAQANTFTTDVLNLFKVKRRLYRFRAEMGLFTVNLFDKINVTSRKAGLQSGKDMVVLHAKYFIEGNIVEITGWG